MFRIVRLWTLLLVVGPMATVSIPVRALAASSASLAGLYPVHTRIIDLPHLTNVQMDCKWGFSCEGGKAVRSAPIFHFQSQDDLHRLDGWARFGDRQSPAPRMLFAIFASRYSSSSDDGLPWNVEAFSDFRGALMRSGYNDLSLARTPRLIPRGTIGNTSLQIVRSRDADVLAIACWTRSIEVEGIAVYAHGSVKQYRLALHALTRQARAAVNSA